MPSKEAIEQAKAEAGRPMSMRINGSCITETILRDALTAAEEERDQLREELAQCAGFDSYQEQQAYENKAREVE